MSVQIPVQTGSRNEVEPGKSGFAHFFEHMMFRGTKAYPPDAYQAILTRAGARQNAYTTDDYTNYHMTFAREDLARSSKIEADRFQNLDVHRRGVQDRVARGARRIQQEQRQPRQKLIEVQRENAFKVHTYRHTTMGFLKDIEDMPNQFEYSKVFFDRWYRPEYTTLIVAGDVNAAEVLPLVEKYWGAWKRGSYKVDIPREPPADGPGDGARRVGRGDAALGDRRLPGGRRSRRRAANFAALDLLMDLYVRGDVGALQGLVEDEQKVDRSSRRHRQRRPGALQRVRAREECRGRAVRARRDPAGVRRRGRRAGAAAQRLADAGPTPATACCARSTTPRRLPAMLARFVRFRRSYDTVNQLFRAYESLTPADLQAAARQYFIDAGAGADDALEGAAARGDRDAAGARHVRRRRPARREPPQRPRPPRPPPACGPAGSEAHRGALVVPQLNVKLQFTVGSAHDPRARRAWRRSPPP